MGLGLILDMFLRLQSVYPDRCADRVSTTFGATGYLPTMFRLWFHSFSARDLASKDANGFSDPYLVIRSVPQNIISTPIKSEIINKSLNPCWNLDATIEIREWDPESVQFTFTVFDHDVTSADDEIGHCTFSLPTLAVGPSHFDLALHEVWRDFFCCNPRLSIGPLQSVTRPSSSDA